MTVGPSAYWYLTRASGAVALGLLLWVPGGPFGPHWARRAGTPSALLTPHSGNRGGAG